MNKIKLVDYVKWIATIIQLIGYGMTGLNMTPYNVYLFFLGIFLWFAVGVMWKDKACLLYTSPSPRDRQKSRMPSSA